MRFSQRKQITSVKVTIQRESMDAPLRNKLWSVMVALFFRPVTGHRWTALGSPQSGIFEEMWRDFWARPLDEMPETWDTAQQFVKGWFFDSAWYEAYDLIEYVIQHSRSPLQIELVGHVNRALEEEVAAYRVVGTHIAELTDEQEIAAIEEALRDAGAMAEVELHLSAAVSKYSDRHAPDYRNSVKEAISAVEAVCQRITGDRSATLGAALKKLEAAGVTLHPALRGGWDKLYGYTSDSGGIRHALSDATTVRAAEAKYMLVTSAAFIHYLVELAEEAGVQLA